MDGISRRSVLVGGVAALAAAASAVNCGIARGGVPGTRTASAGAFTLSDDAWRKRLSPEAYEVLRHGGTEAPGSSALEDEHRPGTYACAGCALPLFDAATKFDSGTGWPSFYTTLPHAVNERADFSLGIARTEVRCRRCDGHLGHVFDDGPKPTGLRYCINGVALTFHAHRSPA